MIPFADFWYICIGLLLALPAMGLGLRGKSIRYYIPCATMVMLVYTFLPNIYALLLLFGYVLYEFALANLVLRKRTFWICLLLSLLPLLLIKVFQSKIDKFFFIHIGLSYISFRSIQVIVEIKDKLIKRLSFFEYMNFLLFFPSLSSGPIDRSRRFITDFNNTPTILAYKVMLHRGINKIFTGLLYKFIIAFLIQIYWLDKINYTDKSFFNSLNYMYAYSSYLFFDFAGYSLFAIGFSYIFAIQTPENFDKPFLSKNIKEFWTRWHMSLSFWFRDFVFMRMVSGLMRSGKIKSRLVIYGCGYIGSFGLMGLWHGFTLYYLIYGFYHALLLTGYEFCVIRKIKLAPFSNHYLNDWLARIITIHFVCIGLLIFSGWFFQA